MQSRSKLIQDIYVPQPSFKKIYNYTPQPADKQFLRPPHHPAPDFSRPKRRIPLKKTIAVGIVSLFVLAALQLGIFKDSKSNVQSKISTAVRSASEEKVKAEPLKNIDSAAAEAQINAIVQKYPGLQIGVSFIDLKTGQAGSYGVTEPFIAASTPKLLTAALFLRQTETGEHSLDERMGGSTAREQLKLMIEKSDNTAWVNLNRVLKSKTLEQYAREIGFKDYNSARNTTTHADIAMLLEKLYNRKLLNEENSRLLLSYMQNASENQYIASAVGAPYKVYHKAGYLKDRAHDAAIIDDGKRPFALVIFSKANNGQYDFNQGVKIMRDITTVMLTAYAQL